MFCSFRDEEGRLIPLGKAALFYDWIVAWGVKRWAWGKWQVNGLFGYNSEIMVVTGLERDLGSLPISIGN